jgi:hypothetical protein
MLTELNDNAQLKPPRMSRAGSVRQLADQPPA